MPSELHGPPGGPPTDLDRWLAAHRGARPWRPATSRSVRAILVGLAAVAVAAGMLATDLLDELHPLLPTSTRAAAVLGAVAVGLGALGLRDRRPGDRIGRAGQFVGAAALALTVVGLPAATSQVAALLGWRRATPRRRSPLGTVAHTFLAVAGMAMLAGIAVLVWVFGSLWCTFMC